MGLNSGRIKVQEPLMLLLSVGKTLATVSEALITEFQFRLVFFFSFDAVRRLTSRSSSKRLYIIDTYIDT